MEELYASDEELFHEFRWSNYKRYQQQFMHRYKERDLNYKGVRFSKVKYPISYKLCYEVNTNFDSFLKETLYFGDTVVEIAVEEIRAYNKINYFDLHKLGEKFDNGNWINLEVDSRVIIINQNQELEVKKNCRSRVEKKYILNNKNIFSRAEEILEIVVGEYCNEFGGCEEFNLLELLNKKEKI